MKSHRSKAFERGTEGAPLFRRLLTLAFLALGACAAAGVGISQASFTSASASGVTASAASSSDIVHLYSSTTDPDAADRPGYATKYGVTPATWCATGQDEAITIDTGIFPRSWLGGNYDFRRVITLKTPTAFPDPAMAPVTVTISLVADSATGRQPLRNVGLAPIGGTGAANPVTMNVNQKMQLNLRVTIGAFWYWLYGDTYTPHVRFTITYAGGPAGYYVYDFPVLVRIA